MAMAAWRLFRARLSSCNRIGSARAYCKARRPYYESRQSGGIIFEWESLGRRSFPKVFFVKNHDIPHSMFMRLAACKYPPDQEICNEFMQKILLHPPIAQPAVARHCLALMIMRGTDPDLLGFSILVKSYCKDLHLKYHHVHHLVFTQMKAVEVEPDESFCHILLDAVSARFGPIVGYHLLKELRSSCPIRMQLPLSCYNSVVLQFCRKKMAEDAKIVFILIDFLAYMKQERVFPDEKIFMYLIKGHGYGGESFLIAVSIGRQLLALGIKIQATILKKKEQYAG